MQHPEMIASHILGYYKYLFFSSDEEAIEPINENLPSLVTSIDNDNLQHIPSRKAICAMIFDMDLMNPR